MRAGKLRHRVTLEAPVTAQNDLGEEVVTWAPIGTAWAAIEPIRGREFTAGGQILADADVRIRLRWSPLTADLTPKHRITRAGKIYNIYSAVNGETRDREIEVMAKEGANRG